MDKRSLVFMFSVTLAFFVTNTYFSHQNQLKKQEHLIYLEEKQQKIEEEQKASILSRTLDLEAFDLVEMYRDDGASEFLGTGFPQKDTLLTMAWQMALPEQIYVRKRGTTDPLVPYFLNTLELQDDEVVSIGQPIVYSKDGKQKLEITDIPLFGVLDLQLLRLQMDLSERPHVALGEVFDGQFSSLSLSDEPLGDRGEIALVQLNKKLYPVGVVQGSFESFVDLEDFPSLRGQMEKMAQDLEHIEAQEEYYVLENGYQQVVISSIGGSVVELNLPLTQDSAVSVVRPVEVDRAMVVDSPRNAYFPLHPYKDASGVLRQDLHKGGYYPLLRRDQYQENDKTPQTLQPQLRACAIVSEYPELASLPYQVVEYTPTKLVLEGKQKFRTIRKTYSLSETSQATPYVLDLEISIDGESRGLWLTTGVPEAEWIAGSLSPSLKLRTTKKGSGVVESLDLPVDSEVSSSVKPDWICNSNGFFGLLFDPTQGLGEGYRTSKIPGATAPSRLSLLTQMNSSWTAQDVPGYLMMLPLQGQQTHHFRLFCGPLATETLKRVDAEITEKVGQDPQYILTQTFHGWFAFISEPFAKFLYWIMQFFYNLFGSWALSIVLLTIVLKILLYPLNAWSTRSMLGMQRISPKLQKLQEKYKNDQQKLQQEMFALYRQEKVNPLSGCLPMLIQLPFLIGMFDLLKSTFALRGASFIPGWIDDLAAPDVVFTWTQSFPLIGNALHILPIFLGLAMFFQSRMMMKGPKNGAEMTEQQRQQKAQGTIMAIFFTCIFYKTPSGLNIYWLSSMILGALQQMWMSRQLEKAKG